MGLINTEVDVSLATRNIKHYETLGYEIPRYTDKKGRLKAKIGTKIKVKVEDLPYYSKYELEAECDECGKEYLIKYFVYNDINHDGKIYCNSCANHKFNSGENCNLWNPNLTDEERKIKRHYPEYTDFIKRVIVRDNHTCQCCGQYGGDLEVHHLDGYDWCVEKRTDETNGVCLCSTCHKAFHARFGYGGNTKEQYEKWIGHAVGELEKYNGELPTARLVYCIEEKKIYNSTKVFAKEKHIAETTVRRTLNKKFKLRKIKLHIMWYDEFILMSEDEVQNYINWCDEPIRHNIKLHKEAYNKKKVICITTLEVFDCIISAKEKYNTYNISACCNGQRNSSGKLQDGTKLQWMYLDNYIEQNNIENIEEFIDEHLIK